MDFKNTLLTQFLCFFLSSINFILGEINYAFKDVKQPITQPIRSYEDYYSRVANGVLEEIHNLTGCRKPCQYRSDDAHLLKSKMCIFGDIGMTCDFVKC